MFTVTKDGKTMRLGSDVQLAAFQKSGWELVDSGMSAEQPLEPAEVATLNALKVEADSLGIKYHWNIGADKLREQITEYKSQNEMT